MRSHYRPLLFLIVIFLFGALLRFINLHDTFFFGYDQARDIHEIYEMVTIPKFKIVGPGTDIPGLFSGPFLYYLLAIPYAITLFNPNAAALTLTFINLTGILLLYYFGKKINSIATGLVAASLWAVSFEQANFARFISNPSFLSILAIIFFLGLYIYCIEKKWWGLPISVIGLGLGTQLDFYLVYLIILYPLFYVIFRPPLSKKASLWGLLCGAFLFSSFVIAEIKFQFIGTTSLIKYIFSHQSQGLGFQGILFLTSLNKSLHNALFALPNYIPLLLFGVALVLFFVTYKEKNKRLFLLLWVFSSAPLFIFKGTNIVGGNFVHSTIQPAIILVLAIGISSVIKSKFKMIGYFVLAAIIIGNLALFIGDGFRSSFVLGHQNMLYFQQKQLVDYTYKKTAGKPFSVCSVSNPLFINYIWSVIYKLHGEKKYGYLPFWSGPIQTQSKSFLRYDTKHEKIRFLIIEPSNTYPSYVPKITEYAENKISKIIEEKKFGELRVQMRQLLPEHNQNQQKKEGEYEEILKSDNRYQCFFDY